MLTMSDTPQHSLLWECLLLVVSCDYGSGDRVADSCRDKACVSRNV